MDSSPRIGSDIFIQFVRCIKQIDAIWNEIDECCYASLKRAYELCFIVPDNEEDTVVSSSESRIPKVETSAVTKNLAQVPNNSVPAKKPRLSLHSKKCVHSPHNRRPELPLQPTGALTPTNEAGATIVKVQNTPARSRPADQQLLAAAENNAAAMSHESVKTENMAPKMSSAHETFESHEKPVTPSDQVHRSIDHTDVFTSCSPDKQALTLSDDTAPQNSSQSSSVINTSVSDSLPLLQAKSTSLGISHHLPYAEMRPFASVERLGGISRLQTLGSSISNTASKPSSKLQCITEKPNQRVSQSNNSHSGNPPHRNDERSRSVLAAREQMLAEKRRLYESRRQENEARLRAFQEAKQQEREALKRANEQRRLAVKSKAEQLAEMQRIAAENKHQTVVARAKIETEKLKQASVTAKPILSRLGGKENIPASQPRPVAVKLPNATVTYHTAAEKSFTQTPGNILKPLHLNKPNAVPVPSSTAAKPTAHPPSSITANATPNLSKLPPPPPQTVVNERIVQLLSPVADKTFDMSQLNSDSESDDEKPGPKPPSWSRKGNLELLPSFRDMRNGALKFPSQFLIAAQIPFNLNEVFAGFAYRSKARTSSGVW